jgi:signal transduction histidine kinase
MKPPGPEVPATLPPLLPTAHLRRLRLVNALLLASAVPLTLLSLGIGALNWWNGQRTAATLAEALGTSITEQVRLQLDQLLAVPRQINALNASAIREGRLDPDDFPQLARTFISQMAVFPAGYINYGNEAGEYVGIERLDSGALQLNLTDRRRGLQRQYVYAVDPQGPASQPLKIFEQISPATAEAWYAETARADRPTWSSIYQWDDKPEVLSISYNEPVRHPDGRLRGVIGVDFILTQLNSKLARIWGQRAGLVVITERNGRLVASSNGNTIETSPGKAPRRRWINRSLNPLEREAGQLLFLPSSGQLRLHEELVRRGTSARINQQLGTTHAFVEVLPWSDSHGLDWVVLVIIPRQSLTGAVLQQTLLTSLLGLLALLTLLLLSGHVTRWILRPLEELSEAARQLGEAIRRSPGAPLQFNAKLARGSAEEIENLGGAMGGLIANVNGLVNALQRSSNRLERELDQKARALDQASRREQEELASRHAREGFLGQLGAAMLHPLADLRGAARLARRETNPQRLRHQLDRLEASAHRLGHLAHNLHDHAQLAEGALSLRIAPLALRELLESSTEAQRSAARSSGVALDWRIAPGTPETLEGDRMRLQQVLEHLLARAIRQGSGGAVRLEASTTSGGPEPRLLLRVRCDGTRLGSPAGGPAPAGSPLVPTRQPQSIDELGPTVCHQLVALMGGSISLANATDQGSGASLELPLDPVPAANP